MTNFVHLNVASAFSGHYGVTRPELLAEAAASQGCEALAVTDRDGLYGAVKHIGACLRLGIAPIVGVSLPILSDDGDELARCVILAHGHDRGRGWATLCSLVSAAHQPASSQRKRAIGIKRSELIGLLRPRDAASQASVTLLLGPQSDLGVSILNKNKSQARTILRQWQNALPLPGLLALEIVSHLTEPGTAYSTLQARRMLELAESAGLPAILSNAVRYLEPDDALTADVLDAARHLEPLGCFAPQPNAQAWLKPAAQMEALALEIAGEAVGARRLLDTTSLLAERCRLDPAEDCGWGRPKTPEKSALGISGNPFQILSDRAWGALEERYRHRSQAERSRAGHRLAQELLTINKLDFATYFLTVADVAQLIRDMRVRIAARGSGAGSLVNYLLGISGVDPIEHDLLFERFLSTERTTLPDIDIDVESARRHDIYRAIFKRYGSDRVTLLSMQSTYRGRGAVRDSGLALGLDQEQIDEIAKNVWRFSAGSFRGAIERKPELQRFAEALEQDRRLNLLVDITERLDRLPRHISMHPCGVILGDTSLLNLTPVQPSGLGLPMSQFDKDDMDPMGMLKLDVLGVRMQSAMAYAVQEVARVRGVELELDQIPRDDPATFANIQTTNTLGIFQIESPGQRELTGKHQPSEFNDLTIQISLFRPGPMKGNMIAPYLDCRHGFARPDYPHPDLEPILRETFGVVIFHEQVLRILHKMTGCGLAKADEYRRSLERPKLKPKIEQFFREQAAARGYSSAVIDRVWAILEGFGSFGFCKAHGAAFALPTYQSAWLKTHYPTEFMAGLFTHDPGMYPRRLLLAEARRLGVRILPLDVNRSGEYYRVEPAARRTTDPDEPDIGVRLALSEVAGMSEAELKRIIQGQPYRDLVDFHERARPTRPTFERLALVGALDELARADGNHSRGDVIARARQLTGRRQPRATDEAQPALDFTVLDSLPSGNPEPSGSFKIEQELRILGMDVSGHQLEQYRPMLEALGVVYANELVDLRNRSEVLIAGVRVATQTPPMRSGKRVVFISLDDGTGCSDATFFEDAQQRASQVLFNNKLLLIAGKTRRTGVRGVSIMAENAWDLRELWRRFQKGGNPLAA